jgi:hypothetical protein
MMHIATCFDQNFEVRFSILANSIETHSRSNVTMHAIHNGPVEYARATTQNLKKLNVVFHDCSGFLGKYRVMGPQTVTTFARLHLHQLLDGVTRGRPGRWERIFWESLFDLRPLDAEIVKRLVIRFVQQVERVHATREAFLRSRSRLARAWWRAVRRKLGIGRAEL